MSPQVIIIENPSVNQQQQEPQEQRQPPPPLQPSQPLALSQQEKMIYVRGKPVIIDEHIIRAATTARAAQAVQAAQAASTAQTAPTAPAAQTAHSSNYGDGNPDGIYEAAGDFGYTEYNAAAGNNDIGQRQQRNYTTRTVSEQYYFDAQTDDPIARLADALHSTLANFRDTSINPNNSRLINRLTCAKSLPTFDGNVLE